MNDKIEKKKVLILYNKLFHYRIPIFKILAESVNLTVAYSQGEGSNHDQNFKVIKLPIFKYGRFVIHKINIYKICEQYDVVIAYGDIAWLSLSTLPFRRKRDFKIIFWSIGVSASYDKKFDAISKWDKIRNIFYRKADALIFYTDYPFKKYIKNHFNPDKLFVACNTVEVYNDEKPSNSKDSLLFIGTLYMQKGLLQLLENYKIAQEVNSEILPLNIVGGGTEFDTVKNWIENNGLSKKIFLHGPVYDIRAKADFFNRAIACISPLQAGLSVLESMGYGVPFITLHDSITGGERLNIQHGVNGILMQYPSEIKGIILDITANPKRFVQMGNAAKAYYLANRKPEHMAKGLLNAIEYVSKIKE